jgi:hypothetical protein
VKRKRKRPKPQKHIFHKNREISILTIKKKTAITLPQEATERTKQGETKNKTKKRKTHSGMNKSASLTPVQGPSNPQKHRKKTEEWFEQ